MACAHKSLIYIPSEDNDKVMLEVCLKCGASQVVEEDDPGYELEGDLDPDDWGSA